MQTPINFLRDFDETGTLKNLELSPRGVLRSTREVGTSAKDLYRAANSAWRLSVRDGIEDGDNLGLIDSYIYALIRVNSKIAISAQPDLIGIHCPWIRDTQVHYSPRYWLNRLIGKRHAN